MRVAVRRAVGVGGAAAVALGAVMALALPASAHTPKIKAGCNDYGQATVSINLRDYKVDHHKKNTVTLTEDKDTVLLPTTTFGEQYPVHQTRTGAGNPANWKTFTVDGTDAHHFVMSVTSIDGIGEGYFPADSTACPQPTDTTTTTTTTTTDTVPPTDTSTSSSETTPPATTTSEAVVAAATTTQAPPGAQQLAFTGVNAALPIGIAAALVVVGGGILFWLRFNSRRKTS